MEKTIIQPVVKDIYNKKSKRRLDGKVVSNAMQSTVIVKVDRVKIHPRYKKRYTTSKKYACDCKGIDLKVGEKVVIEETRPISKTKKWKIVK